MVQAVVIVPVDYAAVSASASVSSLTLMSYCISYKNIIVNKDSSLIVVD